jgi:Arm DNA-binding domain
MLFDMRKKLTPKLIDSLPPATGKRYEVRDELLTALLVRVSSTGGKVWYTSCRIEGKIRRIKIGTYPILSLADAREKARALLRDVRWANIVKRTRSPRPSAGSYPSLLSSP